MPMLYSLVNVADICDLLSHTKELHDMHILPYHRWLTMVVLLLLCGTLMALPSPIIHAQESDEIARIAASPSRPSHNSEVILTITGFLPHERVSLWQTYPDIETVVAIGDRDANDQGAIRMTFIPNASLPIGRHHISVRGNRSGQIAITYFDLQPVDHPIDDQVEVSAVISGNRVIISGAGFGAGEQIMLWLNRPDFSVIDLGSIHADADGLFEFATSFDRRFRMGHHTIVAHGMRTELSGVGMLNVTTPPVQIR